MDEPCAQALRFDLRRSVYARVYGRSARRMRPVGSRSQGHRAGCSGNQLFLPRLRHLALRQGGSRGGSRGEFRVKVQGSIQGGGPAMVQGWV